MSVGKYPLGRGIIKELINFQNDDPVKNLRKGSSFDFAKNDDVICFAEFSVGPKTTFWKPKYANSVFLVGPEKVSEKQTVVIEIWMNHVKLWVWWTTDFHSLFSVNY